MPVRGVGFIQGCNAQNVISDDKLVIATELTQDTTGTQWFEPMLAAALDAATLITAHPPPETSSTPAGQNAPAGQDSTAGQDSAAAHDSGIGQFLADAGYCCQRGHIAETPHGHIKHNMGIRQLSMRGMPKAAAEWTFTCTVCNLFEAITTGHLTPATLAALATRPA
ncbi:MAG TPA: hypothetical protein VMV92_21095 [Streptosporangiaceae bacterium]|nr:hypothetical protein [Streptosporangiaceae bacterium]